MDFTLANLDGAYVRLSDLNGKVVVLDFWATWCGPCIGSFPRMQELVNQFQNDSVEFLFINSWERQEPDKTREKVIKFLEDNGYNFNVLFDFNDEVISRYKVQGIPSRFLIDRNGNLRAIIRYTDDLAAMINEGLK
jgi:thiol-disulfide isomerase/thioredoxin